MQLARVPFAEADRIAKSLVGSRPTFVERKRTYGKLPPIERWSYPILDAPKVVRMYVESRGLSLTELHARVEGCRFCWDLGPLDYRIIFPVIVNKQIVNYAGRDFMHRRVPKYKALSDDQALLNIDEVLFGIDDIKQNRNVVIVEGALDKVKLGIGAVASWGVSLSSAQVKLLREKHPNKVFILLDTEAVDRGVADAMMRQIWFANTTILRLTEYGDPGEIPVTEGAELMMRLAYV